MFGSKRTCVLRGIRFTKHFFDFDFVETNQLFNSNSNVILTLQTCCKRSGTGRRMAAGSKRRALAFYFSVRIFYKFQVSKCRGESDLGLCMTSGFAKRMPLRSCCEFGSTPEPRIRLDHEGNQWRYKSDCRLPIFKRVWSQDAFCSEVAKIWIKASRTKEKIVRIRRVSNPILDVHQYRPRLTQNWFSGTARSVEDETRNAELNVNRILNGREILLN